MELLELSSLMHIIIKCMQAQMFICPAMYYDFVVWSEAEENQE